MKYKRLLLIAMLSVSGVSFAQKEEKQPCDCTNTNIDKQLLEIIMSHITKKNERCKLHPEECKKTPSIEECRTLLFLKEKRHQK